MQVVSLLIIIILAIMVFKKEKSPYARMVVGSVFGIIFFAVWPFLVFYSEIHKLEEIYIISMYVSISIFAIIFSKILLAIKHKLFIASTSFIVFFSTTLYSISYENEIKNNIFIHSGFFIKNNVKKISHINPNKKRASYTAHNYNISLSKNWVKQTDKGFMFVYFKLINDAINITELRPKCFDTRKTSLADIVKNIENSGDRAKTKTRCYQIDAKNYSCKIDNFGRNKKIERIRWYNLNTETSYGIELDFVIHDKRISNLNEIDYIINSAKLNKKSNTKMSCLSLTEWM